MVDPLGDWIPLAPETRPTGTRRHAREIALQVLYQLDVQKQLSDEQALSLFWLHFDGDGASRVFADELVRGVRLHIGELDDLLGRASRNWRLERMAQVDRNLLRLALYELKYSIEVPSKVAINEAIEIAKRFGTADTPAFVNGILDRCLEEVGTR